MKGCGEITDVRNEFDTSNDILSNGECFFNFDRECFLLVPLTDATLPYSQVISFSMKAGLQKRQSIVREAASPGRNHHHSALSPRRTNDVTKGSSDVTRTA